ncbi:bifunctional DNA primase/polymerase [Devosia alba]|uniref:bifunctional DNA primase/polymerase n=1 Tax=Devosia alba TaxID=3152360 RepID=UPI003266C16C
MTDFKLNAEMQFESSATAAQYYWQLGWEPLPLPANQKKPQRNWKTPMVWTNDDISRKFSPVGNVGLALGERSGGLIDIDFDWSEAAQIGRELLSDLPSFGRVGSPYSHRFARGKLTKGVVHFQIPKVAAHLFDGERLMVLELRGDGHQTMVPPSLHPSGERVRWHNGPGTIPEINGNDLERRAGQVAFMALILRAYPRSAGYRDDVCLALTGTLLRAGIDEGEIDRLVELVANLAGDDEAAKRGGKAAASRAKLDAQEEVWGLPKLCELLGISEMEPTLRKWLGALLSGDPGSDGNAITIRPGFLPQAVDAAEAALLTAGVPIYQRYDTLVRPIRLKVSADLEGVGRDSGALILQPVVAAWLREQFALTAKWLRETEEGPKRIDPPSQASLAYLARVGDWRAPFLQGVIQSPTLRADGTMLQEPGYDAASALLYDPGNVVFESVPEIPSKADAEHAIASLAEPFRDFCFASAADRSVTVAAVLTALVRPMFPAAPLFAIDAPTAGTGKSLLAETVGIIATGHKPAMLSQGFNGEEDQKRLSSVLMAGDQIIVIDNCDRPIQGEFLCTMLTQEHVRPRILGKSEMRTLPTRCLVMATGNNLTLSGDVTRRALICRMDAGMERPDQRQFGFDPRIEARANRPRLVTAGLTVLRAYIAAGRPNPMDKIGSFEDWNLVREAIVWLGYDDPADTRERVLADDPAKAVLLDLLRLWWTTLKDRPVTLAELAVMADKQGKGSAQDLVTELIATTRYQHFNARSVGRFLAKHVDRRVGGLVLLSVADGSGVKAYRVMDVSTAARAERSDGGPPF